MAACKVKVCRICFSMDCQLQHLHENMKLYKAYEEVTQLALANEEDLPPYLCTSCADQLMTCARFRHRSLQAHLTLLDILKKHGHISVESIQAIKTTNCDSNKKYTEEERTLSNIKIEIKREDIPEDPIATDLSDNIKTEYIPDVLTDDELVRDEAVLAPCVVTTNVTVKMEALDETMVNDNLDNRKLSTDPMSRELGDNIRTEYITDDLRADDDLADEAVAPCVETHFVTVKEVFDEAPDSDNGQDSKLGTVFKMPTKNAVKCKNYRDRRKPAAVKTKPAPKTASERMRLYRLRKKQLAEASKSSANEVVYTPSTSNSRMTLQPSPQRATADEDGVHEELSLQENKLNLIEAREGMEVKKDLNQTGVIQHGAKVNEKLLQNLFSNLENDSKIQFSSPLQSHPNTTLHCCYMCDFKTESKITILAHMTLHSGGKSQSSNVLKKPYRRKSSQINNSSKNFSCDICKKSYLRKVGLQRHMLVHTDTKQHTCEVCDKSFRGESGLKSHMLLHSDHKQYSCDMCDKSYYQKTSLQYHLQTHLNDKRVTCDLCKKTFRNKGYLQTHMLIHAGVKPHSCDVCKKSFRDKGNLQKHVLIHTGHEPHKCHVCEKTFRLKSTLTVHLWQHTGHKPFTCEICNKSFHLKFVLQNHMLIHRGDKSHTCDACGKSFHLKVNLQRHQLRHVAEKPFKCDRCDKSFRHKYSLKMHVLTHDGERP